MFGLTQVTADTPYSLLIPMLFVMGLGMGATMMPLFTSALKTLAAHAVARGSTLLTITQQVAASIGVATMSVLLTNNLNSSPVIPGTEQIPGLDGGMTEAEAAILSNVQPEVFAPLGIPARVRRAWPGRRRSSVCRHLLGGLDPGGADPDPGNDAAPQA